VAMCRETLAQANFVAVPTLRRERPEPSQLLGALATVWVDGGGVDWEALCDRPPARRVELPTYAFQRERYWSSASLATGLDAATDGSDEQAHPPLDAADRSLFGLDWQ